MWGKPTNLGHLIQLQKIDCCKYTTRIYISKFTSRIPCMTQLCMASSTQLTCCNLYDPSTIHDLYNPVKISLYGPTKLTQQFCLVQPSQFNLAQPSQINRIYPVKLGQLYLVESTCTTWVIQPPCLLATPHFAISLTLSESVLNRMNRSKTPSDAFWREIQTPNTTRFWFQVFLKPIYLSQAYKSYPTPSHFLTTISLHLCENL